ncbi:glycogen/starch synthase, partial [Flavobacteriales bacterium]|nr:glycogen/starch synthase [Flavobacteriales bacterium]
CHGWMSALVPMYLKKAFAEDPIFDNTKVVYSVYDQESDYEISDDMARKALLNGVEEEDIKLISSASVSSLHKLGVQYADAIIMGSDGVDEDLDKFIVDSGKYVLSHHDNEGCIEPYNNLYDELLEEIDVYS